MQLPCHICGRPIDYDLPSGTPGSFEIDEIIPVSKWQYGGFSSPRSAAECWENLAPAHRLCNQLKSNRLNYNLAQDQRQYERDDQRKKIIIDGKW